MKAFKYLAIGAGCAIASYATYAAVTWFRYGKPKPPTGKDVDPLMDRFMPNYDVADRHKTYIAAPPDVVLSAATETDLESSAIVRAIFKGRELLLASKPVSMPRPPGLLAQVTSLGWGILAEQPGREIVMGAVTKPWDPNPVFRALPPDAFADFQDPGFVKIIWTLRADLLRNGASVFRTETRAIATDPISRKRFRRYWSFLSPGIIAIRRVMLPLVKREAERRTHFSISTARRIIKPAVNVTASSNAVSG